MSTLTKKSIIVPWDFTPEAEIALQHAYQLAQVVGDNIMLVSLVRKPGWMSNKSKYYQTIQEIKVKLEAEAIRLNNVYTQNQQNLSAQQAAGAISTQRTLYQVEILPSVIGFRDPSTAFKELYHSKEINMVVTRQYYKGEEGKMLDLVGGLSRLRLGKVNSLPFIIVTEPPKHMYYTELVVPMSYENSYKETLSWVAYLANYYHCNVNMIKPPLKDERRKKWMANNLYFTKKILDAKDVVYGIKTSQKKEDFQSEVFRFAADIDADMIIVMTDQQKFFFGTDDVKSVCPVMLINPLSKRYQSFN